MKEKTFTVPDGATIITDGMIPRDTTDVIIPEGLTKISDGAFVSCTSLKTVVIPDGVTEIGEGAFASCTSLELVLVRHLKR